jgi:hypothetical protein
VINIIHGTNSYDINDKYRYDRYDIIEMEGQTPRRPCFSCHEAVTILVYGADQLNFAMFLPAGC